MSLVNQLEDRLEESGVATELLQDFQIIVADRTAVPSQLLLKFAGYTPTLFESQESKNAGILANLARLVLLAR